MRYVTNILLKGLGAVLPVALTLYLVYLLGRSLELVLHPVILFVLPQQYYRPGMGFVSGLLLLFLIGLLVDAWIVRRLFRFGESFLKEIPLIKSVYGGLRDFVTYFASMQKKKDVKNVVTVQLGETHLLGFLTSDKGHNNFPEETSLHDLVAVYLPMSYNIGGYTIYVRRDSLQFIDMSVEDALRIALTAGLSHSQENGDK